MTNTEKRKAVYNKFGGHCAYCGKEIKFKDMQIDHLEPKANTRAIGKDLEGNYIYPNVDRFENLMPSCRRCNHYKRAETLEHFRIMIKTIHKRITNFYIAKVALDFGIIEYHEWDGIFYFERIVNRQK
jgi:5-methylcytosine-specific restriction endonuclease McrA